MFGTTHPPSNKWLVEHANVKGRIAQESGMAKSIRGFIHPAQLGHFTRKPSPPKQNNPIAREYRIERKIKRAGLHFTGIKNAKQLQALQRANNYATGRTTNKPSNSTMRFYYRTHPRARASGYNNPRNIQRGIKNSIQSNLFENMPVPNRANLREKWQMLTNTNHVKNLNNLVNKMANYHRAYRESNEKKWARHNKETFAQLYERAANRNKYGFYYR
jgi:hypothetical protein